MWKDPIVADVRRVRLEIEEECEGDFDKIYARAIEIQKKFVGRLISDPVDSAIGREDTVVLKRR
ncbi:MAG: hypothetical protein ACRD4L_03490 [Pyrinomonadaceae bacterium]